MANVLIKDVPVGCEEAVKRLAMIAIERFLKPTIEFTVVDTYQDSIDNIYVANDLPKKFKKDKEE